MRISYFFKITTLIIATIAAGCGDVERKFDNKEGSVKNSMAGQFVSYDNSKTACPMEGYTIRLRDIGAPSDFWNINLEKSGVIKWNGTHVDVNEINNYVNLTAYNMKYSGNISISAEKGTPCIFLNRIRKIVFMSGMCRQNRCFERSVENKAPIVN